MFIFQRDKSIMCVKSFLSPHNSLWLRFVLTEGTSLWRLSHRKVSLRLSVSELQNNKTVDLKRDQLVGMEKYPSNIRLHTDYEDDLPVPLLWWWWFTVQMYESIQLRDHLFRNFVRKLMIRTTERSKRYQSFALPHELFLCGFAVFFAILQWFDNSERRE